MSLFYSKGWLPSLLLIKEQDWHHASIFRCMKWYVINFFLWFSILFPTQFRIINAHACSLQVVTRNATVFVTTICSVNVSQCISRVKIHPHNKIWTLPHIFSNYTPNLGHLALRPSMIRKVQQVASEWPRNDSMKVPPS